MAERIDEGMGETVFEIGYENNGDCMQLSLDEWNTAYARLVAAAKGARADCVPACPPTHAPARARTPTARD